MNFSFLHTSNHPTKIIVFCVTNFHEIADDFLKLFSNIWDAIFTWNQPIFCLSKISFSFSRKIQQDLKDFDAVEVSLGTIRNRLNEAGYNGRRPRKTPFLKDRHKKARLKFAKTHRGKSLRFWKKILWSDETKLEIWGTNVSHVWREVGTAYDERNTIPTVKHPPSLML